MKTEKLKETVVNATSVSEVYGLMQMIYETKEHNVHMTKTVNGWSAKVFKVKKVVNGKDVYYKENFLLKESGSTFVEAFKSASLAWLK